MQETCLLMVNLLGKLMVIQEVNANLLKIIKSASLNLCLISINYTIANLIMHFAKKEKYGSCSHLM